jgi:hypothetical protein
MQFPRMLHITQQLYRQVVPDIDAEVNRQLLRAGLPERLRPRMRIAVTAGSRGIAGMPEVLRATVAFLKANNTRPFLVPAMGSHGGATAEGQVQVLENLGVTEASMGAPIRSSMKVVEIGKTEFGTPVYLDAIAAAADGIVVVNRVKEHTDFVAPIESGLMKMLTIGLGKHLGASTAHSLGYDRMLQTIQQSGRMIIAKGNVLCGVALVEDGYHNLAVVEAFRPERIEAGEARLLRQTKKHAARLPFSDIDILIVEALGKNISGAGMDPNVIGRNVVDMHRKSTRTHCYRVVVLGLTRETKGSAVGIGMADLTTRAVADAIDTNATYANVLTSGSLGFGKLPVVLENDRAVITAALTSGLCKSAAEVRVVRIKNTLRLDEMEISEGLLAQAQAHPALTITGKPHQMRFDTNGKLL